MKKTITILIALFLSLSLSLSLSFADEQPTQNYNKFYLKPFYRDGLIGNTEYNYSVQVKTYDGISSVVSAIINFELYLSPALNTSIKVNGIPCNTPYYYVSTTYANTNFGKINFDCTNVINNTGNYTITIKTSKNTGAITGWLDLTYMNKPKPSINIKGTEYYQGDIGKVFLQLLDENRHPINNSKCFISIYYPDSTNFINNQEMNYVNEGLYAYDLDLPYITGVYMVSANCKVPNPYSILKESFDNFECGYTNCGYGWDSNWTLSADASVSTLASYEGTYGLRIVKKGTAERNFTINTSSEQYTLSFYARITSFEGGEYCYVYLCSNTNCTLVKQFSQANSDGQFHLYSFTFNDNTIKTIKITMNSKEATDYCDFDLIKINQYYAFNQTEYVEVKGSSEIHINPLQRDIINVYTESYLVNCTDKYYNGSDYDYEEGMVVYEIIVKSQSMANNQPIKFFYESPWKFDCSSFVELFRWNGTDWENADYLITHTKSGRTKENCLFMIEDTINSGETKYYMIYLDNYQRWEILWTKHIIDYINETIYDYCEGIKNGFEYEVPITKYTARSNDTKIDMCHSIYDDIYYANNLYENALNYSMCEQEGYLTELVFYRDEIEKKAIMLGFDTIKIYNNITNKDVIEKLISINETFKNYITDLNSTINNRFDNIENYILGLNDSIKECKNEIILKIEELNSSILNKLDSIISKLQEIQDNITTIYILLNEHNETIMNKLNEIQTKIDELKINISILNQSISNSIENIKNELIDMILNISNVTYNISVSQEEVIGTMLSIYGHKLSTTSYAYMGFIPTALADETSIYYCKDNETLVKKELINIEGSMNKTYMVTREIKCTYGCSKDSCILPPYSIWLFVLIMIISIFFIYLYITKPEYY